MDQEDICQGYSIQIQLIPNRLEICKQNSKAKPDNTSRFPNGVECFLRINYSIDKVCQKPPAQIYNWNRDEGRHSIATQVVERVLLL
jgi:hypothetical protein